MFGIGPTELIIVLVIALIVIGPSKLPDLARALGKGMAEFKKATREIKESLDLNEDFEDVRRELVDSVSGLDEPIDLEASEKEEENVSQETEINERPEPETESSEAEINEAPEEETEPSEEITPEASEETKKNG
jgi:TatA/E family protein of Tat protein translocase